MTLEIVIRDEANPADARQHQIPLTGGAVVLGRGPESPVPLEGTRISRQHLSFEVMGGRLTVTDISSSGIWVNEQAAPKHAPVPVEPLDEIRLPGYRLFATVKGMEPPPPAPTEPQPVRAIPSAPPAAAGPAWWKLDGRELWAVMVLIATGLFLMLYHSM